MSVPEMPEDIPKLDRKIGSGSFGEIYRGLDCKTGRIVAVKLERVNAEFPQLFHEAGVLRDLAGGRGIPQVYQVEKTEQYNVMTMECLGNSLEALFNTCNRKFSLKTTLMIGFQILERVEYIHSKHYLHRDIKPDNFLVGLGANSRMIYAIDFGLAKKYRVQGRHIRYSANHDLTGTARYASINALKGSEQGRRDDLESVGYLLMYFLRGSLPWQGLKAPPPKRHKSTALPAPANSRKRKRQKYDLILQRKLETSPEVLCEGYAHEFAEYFHYVRGLAFDGAPDYEHLRGLLRRVWEREGLTMDYQYDWLLHVPPPRPPLSFPPPPLFPLEKPRTPLLDQLINSRPTTTPAQLTPPAPENTLPSLFPPNTRSPDTTPL